MGLRSLSMEDPDQLYTLVEFSDERANHKWAVASVTLSSDKPGEQTSWGEFLSANDVARLHAWTGALVADYFGRSEDE